MNDFSFKKDFPGLFISKKEIMAMKNHDIPTFQLTSQQSLYSYSAPQSPVGFGVAPCCKTKEEITVPQKVSATNGSIYSIKHLNSCFQLLHTGTCQSTGSCQNGEGTCVQRYFLQWLLVEIGPDSVDFVPVEYPSYCECISVGAALK
ncbi:hypothetical protein SNE40_004948 [Patella caerulea]